MKPWVQSLVLKISKEKKSKFSRGGRRPAIQLMYCKQWHTGNKYTKKRYFDLVFLDVLENISRNIISKMQQLIIDNTIGLTFMQ